MCLDERGTRRDHHTDMLVLSRTTTASVLASLMGILAPAISFPQEVEPNKTAYDLHCALCHGEDGTAVETLEKIVQVEIPHLGSTYVQDQSDSDIRKVILEGKGEMKPVQTISEEEIPGVIAFLRTLEEP